MYKLLPSVALICVATTGTAACFDHSDMGRGVVVMFDIGDAYTIRRSGNGMMVVLEDYADDRRTVRFTGPYGLYFIEEVELDNGRAISDALLQIDFNTATSNLPEPSVGGGWSGETTNIFADGHRRSEGFTASFVAGPEMILSDCTYEVVYANLRYDWPDEDSGMTLEYAYLPALGTAFLLSSQFDNEEKYANAPVTISPASK